MATLTLPSTDGGLENYTTGTPRDLLETQDRPFNRVAYAAAHVVPVSYTHLTLPTIYSV